MRDSYPPSFVRDLLTLLLDSAVDEGLKRKGGVIILRCSRYEC